MTPERWKQIDELAQAALEREGDARTSFLDEACAGDGELRREVESQIAYQQQASKFLEEPAFKHVAELMAEAQTETESMEGRTISHYSILRKLGAGGMGEVYLAQDTTLSRKVAIKFLSDHSGAGDQASRRLVREAKAAAALDHHYICAVYEVGEEAGYNFIVMQYVEGETLASRMQRQPIEFREALDIAVQIADALAEAHSHKIIHRDIKPQNVMLTTSGQVKVLDFGLARFVREGSLIDSFSETESLLTAPGSVIGTVPYMSPEQVRGEALDGRSDIFSFGAVLYEMLSGRNPFQAESVGGTMSSILTKEPAPLARYASDVPDELQRMVRKALSKDKEGRYQGIKDLLIDLRELKQEIEFEAKLDRSSEPVVRIGATTPERAERKGYAESETMPVERAHENDSLTTPRTSSTRIALGEIRRHKRGIGIILAMLLVALAAIAYLAAFGRSGKEALSSIAVLPFVNESNDPNAEYLSDGISESLINQLSQLPQLKVIARSSSFKYKGKETDPQELAKALGVRALVTGRVVQRGDHLIISAELVDTRDRTQMWGAQYERPLADLVAVQREIAKEITIILRVKLSGDAQKRITARPAGNAEAYELYLKGRYYLNTLTNDGARRGLEYFQQAIETDSRYAPAYAGLAESYAILSTEHSMPAKEAIPKAKAAALKALEIDEMLAEAHTSLGFIAMKYEWDWSGAEREFKQAIALNPNYVNAHHWYSHYLIGMGRFEESLAESKNALELDPLDVAMNFHLGWHYFYAGHYDQAVEQLRKTLEMNRNSSQAHGILGSVYEQQKHYDEAIAELQKGWELGRTDQRFRIAHIYAVSGRKDVARRMLEELKEESKKGDISPYDLAIIYEGLGDKDHAFAWLEKAYAERDSSLTEVKVTPELNGLRADPRFADLLRRMGVPQ